jgi:hypothetical protein
MKCIKCKEKKERENFYNTTKSTTNKVIISLVILFGLACYGGYTLIEKLILLLK